MQIKLVMSAILSSTILSATVLTAQATAQVERSAVEICTERFPSFDRQRNECIDALNRERRLRDNRQTEEQFEQFRDREAPVVEAGLRGQFEAQERAFLAALSTPGQSLERFYHPSSQLLPPNLAIARGAASAAAYWDLARAAGVSRAVNVSTHIEMLESQAMQAAIISAFGRLMGSPGERPSAMAVATSEATLWNANNEYLSTVRMMTVWRSCTAEIPWCISLQMINDAPHAEPSSGTPK